MIRTAIKDPVSRDSKRQRSEVEAGDKRTVEEYLTGRCEELAQEIQAHADELVSQLRSDYSRQAEALRDHAAIEKKQNAETTVDLVVEGRTPEGQEASSPYEGQKWPLTLKRDTTVPIGRSKAKKFLQTGISMAKDNGVSSSHAKIELREGRVMYTDLGSSNGTILNGKELVEHADTELFSGDKLVLGDTELFITFSVNAPGASKA